MPGILPSSLVTGPYQELSILPTPPHQVESSFNVLEIRAFNTLSQNQVSTGSQATTAGPPGRRNGRLRLY